MLNISRHESGKYSHTDGASSELCTVLPKWSGAGFSAVVVLTFSWPWKGFYLFVASGEQTRLDIHLQNPDHLSPQSAGISVFQMICRENRMTRRHNRKPIPTVLSCRGYVQWKPPPASCRATCWLTGGVRDFRVWGGIKIHLAKVGGALVSLSVEWLVWFGSSRFGSLLDFKKPYSG